MRIISFTVISKENPFDKPVVSELRRIGVDVKIGKRRRVFSLLRAVAKFGQPKTVHLHWLSMFWHSPVFIKSLIKTILFILDLIIIKLLGIKIVWTVHNIHHHEKEHFVLDWLTGMIVARLSSRLIVFCQTAKKEVKKFYYLRNTKKILVIPYAHYINEYLNTSSKSQARKSLNLLKKDFVFLFFGVIRPYKGVLELLSAFRELKEPRARLVIAGLPLGDEFKRKLKLSLRKTKNVIAHLRFIPPKKVQIYMKAADVVVLSYREILSSSSLILAFSFGKPVIAPAMGCIKDYLTPQGGFPYAPQRPHVLLAVMKKAMKADLLKMGEYNLKLAQKLSPKTCAFQLKKIYEGL